MRHYLDQARRAPFYFISLPCARVSMKVENDGFVVPESLVKQSGILLRTALESVTEWFWEHLPTEKKPINYAKWNILTVWWLLTQVLEQGSNFEVFHI